MKAKILLIIGGVILILEGGLLVFAWFDTESESLLCYGVILLLVGIIGILGALFAKRKKAGYFFIIMGIAVWVPIILTVMVVADNNGSAGPAALLLGAPAVIATLFWCVAGAKNINE